MTNEDKIAELEGDAEELECLIEVYKSCHMHDDVMNARKLAKYARERVAEIMAGTNTDEAKLDAWGAWI